MDGLPEAVLWALSTFRIWDSIDIVVMAVLIYVLLSFFRGTTAVSVLYGLGLLLVAMLVVTSIPHLTVLNWMLRNSLPLLSIALVILFQPELRRAMERIGRIRGLINRPLSTRETPTTVHVVEEVARACRRLSERRHGALLVLEQETGLQEFIESGVEIDALTSMDVLITVFFPNSPLHDGAAIIRGDRIIAAGCVLPLSTSSQSHDLGTRHRAALGITEETDALAVVVSEETGSISVANDGRLVRHLDDARLKKVLTSLYHPPTHDVFHLWPISRTLADKSGDR